MSINPGGGQIISQGGRGLKLVAEGGCQPIQGGVGNQSSWRGLKLAQEGGLKIGPGGGARTDPWKRGGGGVHEISQVSRGNLHVCSESTTSHFILVNGIMVVS